MSEELDKLMALTDHASKVAYVNRYLRSATRNHIGHHGGAMDIRVLVPDDRTLSSLELVETLRKTGPKFGGLLAYVKGAANLPNEEFVQKYGGHFVKLVEEFKTRLASAFVYSGGLEFPRFSVVLLVLDSGDRILLLDKASY